MTAKQKFVTQLTVLAETFGRQLTEPAIEGYWVALRDLGEESFSRAVSFALRDSRFMPAPREMRDYVEGSTRITGAMQWAHVRKVLDKIDIYGSPDFGPVVNAVLHALGGWKVLCEKSIPDLVWIQKDFERLYGEYAAKDLSGLRTEGHVGEFGKAPEWCALEGTPKVPKQLESSERHAALAIVSQLAESKS